MLKVTELACGYSLHADPATSDPWFRRGSNGSYLNVWEMARQPEAPQVFRASKRFLDMIDIEWLLPGQYLPWRAADRAKMGLEFSLRMLGRWDDAWKDTGVLMERVP